MHTIKAVGVLSVAKILGMIEACIGLLLMPIFLLMGLAGTLIGGERSPFTGMVGVIIAFMLPIVYGVIGFISGAIAAALYNLFAKWVGGIEVQVQLASASQTSPGLTP